MQYVINADIIDLDCWVEFNMKKTICIIILAIISIVIIALNIYYYKDYKIFTNRIASFNNDQYLLLYSEINPYIETEVNNEKLIGFHLNQS